MELRDFAKILANNKKIIAFCGLLGVLIGGILFVLPSKYSATGSFYVTRLTEPGKEYFSYEGYYAQQTAQSHTNTIAALLESESVQNNALNRLGVEINEITLYKIAKKIRVKKASPQLITLTVKGISSQEALQIWGALADEITNISSNISISGDDKLSVSRVNQVPVVKKGYKSLPINISLGLFFGIAAGAFYVAIKNYDD